MAPAKKAATAPKSQEPEAPFDLDAAVAEVGNEDSQPPFKFSFGGKVWTMRDATDSDARLLANIELNETQQVMAYMRDLLADQWDDFPRISFQAAMILIEKYSDHTQGLALGESTASTESS